MEQELHNVVLGYDDTHELSVMEPDSSGSDSMVWSLSQRLGEQLLEEEVQDGDLITAIEFNEDGSFLAVGDKAGRVWIYEATSHSTSPGRLQYQLYVSFQSHEPEFDYLKSLEIEEKINMIKWCPSHSSAMFLLTTNDKTIKMWKIHNRKIHRISNLNIEDDRVKVPQMSSLRVPMLTHFETVTASTCKRVFSNAHAYHINSISVSSDQETFVSSDDLRVNLWNLGIPEQSFNVVDIKPDNMEELTEVITASHCHPLSCNIFMYSSSRGIIRLVDLRQRALCETPSQVFEVEEDPTEKSFFSEIISSISDVKFTADGRYIISRDYLTLKIWDVAMPRAPLESVPIHDFLRPKLCDLYENDCIFDKFECVSSASSREILTGSYDDNFAVYDWANGSMQLLEVPSVSSEAVGVGLEAVSSPYLLDDASSLLRKALHVAWHPKTNLIAVASLNNLCLYEAS